MTLIRSLPSGPLDIVGDVHGQFEALQNLLHYLGYSPEGRHPQGRRLVFVGDLVDRGPDSPACVAWVMQACQHGRAHMVLGNHELNLLMHEPKDGSGWFFDSRAAKDARQYAPWQRQENGKSAVTAFFRQQPLVLQRQDLRVVHAAWLPEIIEELSRPEYDGRCLLELCREWDAELDCHVHHAPWYDDYLDEQRRYVHGLENYREVPPLLCATAKHDVYRSCRHPARALTCGIETVADAPFFAGGRWRFSVRRPWWNDYRDAVHVVVGHYWRQWYSGRAAKHRREMFTVPPHHWHGARNNVFCLDFSVGARWRDRKRDIPPSRSVHRLAALRWPEKTLVFDNGDCVPTEA